MSSWSGSALQQRLLDGGLRGDRVDVGPIRDLHPLAGEQQDADTHVGDRVEILEVQDQPARLLGEDALDLALEDDEGAHVELAGQRHLCHVAVELGADLERIDGRNDADPDLVPRLVVGDVDGQPVGIEVGVRLAVDLDLADPDAARRQDVRRDAQDVVGETPGSGLK